VATLVLVRHGQASYGQADYDRLSPRGEQQAKHVGEHFRTAPLDALFTGPLKRQRDTAAIAHEHARGALPAPTVIDELAEYPAFELITRLMPRLVAEDPSFAALLTKPSRELGDRAFNAIVGRWARGEWHTDGVERVDEFAARVQRGFDRVIALAKQGARVGVVTSAGPIGVAVGLVFGSSPEHMVRASRPIRNASISELVFRTDGDEPFAWRPEQIALASFNALHHLPAELHTEF